ncbi:MAG: trypsin-like peptidase domain-containing protein [Patescibacteria group bacterium]|nr:trypsin-like peptidase domain-containing protein [bacterium]MDZ4227137.1 trypsin-like peptidase domain-containing protein [Patescibacteria group bacterium]
MNPRLRSSLSQIFALTLLVGALFFMVNLRVAEGPSEATPVPSDISSQTASVAQPAPAETIASSTPPIQPAKTAPQKDENVPSSHEAVVREEKPAPPQASTESIAQQSQDSAGTEVMRIENPYPFSVVSFDVTNVAARNALVNILCMPHSGSLRPISGSGVIIDPRGVILTNAHVAQYVLLSQSSQIDLSCYIRSGSPAIAKWIAGVLYIPPVWVREHASEISSSHPTGTGEHDYALLLIAGDLDGAPTGSTFPYLSVDTREGIAFVDDSILAASYPVEFAGSTATQYNLYAASSVTAIKQLLTFESGTIDLLSLGGIIEAQSGSSGGAVVNAWGYLVGTIVTTSEGDTTATRDLRALTMSYIDRDLATQTGQHLKDVLGGDVYSKAQTFTGQVAPGLIDIYLKALSR